MAQQPDPRVTAYFNCLGSAIRAEERRERTVAAPKSVEPPSVRCIEWVDALEAALRNTRRVRTAQIEADGVADWRLQEAINSIEQALIPVRCRASTIGDQAAAPGAERGHNQKGK